MFEVDLFKEINLILNELLTPLLVVMYNNLWEITLMNQDSNSLRNQWGLFRQVASSLFF